LKYLFLVNLYSGVINYDLSNKIKLEVGLFCLSHHILDVSLLAERANNLPF